MKFGIRRPSLRKRIAARTSWKRVVRNNLGFKAPRGYGWITNPRKAAYNRVYNRTTVGLGKGCLVSIVALIAACASTVSSLFGLCRYRQSAYSPLAHSVRNARRWTSLPPPWLRGRNRPASPYAGAR